MRSRPGIAVPLRVASILLPILPSVPFGQFNFVRRGVVRVNGKIACICSGGIESATRRKKRCENEEQRESAMHRIETIDSTENTSKSARLDAIIEISLQLFTKTVSLLPIRPLAAKLFSPANPQQNYHHPPSA